MKKKIMYLVMTAMLTGLLLMGCNSNDTAETSGQDTAGEETAEDDGYRYVTAAETVEIAKAGGSHVLDVREWSNYAEGRVADSEWCPIFPLEDETLVDDMTAYAEEKLKDGDSIYIICNSGKRGAEKTTEVLTEAGIDASLIYTVEGGAEALGKEKNALTTDRSEENIQWRYATGEETLESTDVQIIDVRDDENYDAGHLKDSIHQDLTDYESSEAQTGMYNLGTADLDAEQPVYFLCYSGNKCAKTAVSVLKDAGFNVDNLFIIEEGAKGSAISDAFVTE